MKFIDFATPSDEAEALAILKELGDDALPVAGGTALHFMADHSTKTAVNIMLPGLAGIEKRNGMFRIGATTTLTDMMRFQEDGWVLSEPCRLVATHQIRNISTLGGNIARVFPWADMPVALLALSGEVVLRGDAERLFTMDEFFASQPARLFRSGELLTCVKVPVLTERTGFGYVKKGLTTEAFSMMTAAACLTIEDGLIKSARIAAGSALPFPRRLNALEERLVGRKPSTEFFADAVNAATKDIGWRGSEGMSDEYAANLARVTLCDALTKSVC